ncbi:unnamed protein product (macronuclear) [Paramecium tetraurelia]|uniref:Uncharacterized protein n=1 Tax=Paramecium tetraurelia TaxID=5888 RepID=A0DWQ2_PARTE|nr:uncharacterized protein GSPATT00021112001 [Paramecium tetraurelia]CAK87469.1 unnamed protein product [Paramecium tetraurelia]|eukprot:XP_001454866.1 hypothetical protein (macronuclear) [Paramecium tetraurelia strain d4-2]
MKNHYIPKSSERYGKLVLPIRHSLPVGLFSSQNSLFASIISVKNREENSKSQKKKNSQTHFEASTQRAVTPNSQNKCIPFTTKYHLSSQPQKQKKKSNLINKESIQSKISNLICQNKSADFNNMSSQCRDGDEQEITKIFNNLKCISQQINAIKANQLSQQILSQWQKVMTSNCEKLVELNKSKKKSEMECPQLIKSNSSSSQINDASGLNLEKLLAEERRNRLLVEEQTSKIISSQESEIKSYIEKIKQLEQRLIEKNSWQT